MRGTPVRFVDFRGGLNTKAAPYLIAENQCRDCNNVVSTVRGSIKKRNGNVSLADTFVGSPTQITSLYPASVLATPVLVAAGGSGLYSISAGGTVQDITGGLTFSNNQKWEFISGPTSGGQGPIFGMNGIDTPKYWVGSGGVSNWTASVGTIPNGKYLAYAANRVWVAGTVANPSRVYFSDLGDPRSWTATNVVDLDPNDGQVITGMARLGSNLIVFKGQKTFLIYDLDTGANRPLSTSIGCVSHRSIAEGPQGLYFLSEDQGVFVTNGSKLEAVSDNILRTMDRITSGQKTNAAAEFYNDHYYLSIAIDGATANNVTLDYDSTTSSWWKHTNAANQFALWRPSSSSNMYLYGANSLAVRVDRFYVPDIFQDAGVNYVSDWTGPWLAFKEPYRHKRGRQIHMEGHGRVNVYMGQNFIQTLSLLRTDAFASEAAGGHFFGDSTLFGGTEIFGDVIEQGEVRIYSLGVARSFSFKFENTGDSDIEVDAYTVMITPRAN